MLKKNVSSKGTQHSVIQHNFTISTVHVFIFVCAHSMCTLRDYRVRHCGTAQPQAAHQRVQLEEKPPQSPRAWSGSKSVARTVLPCAHTARSHGGVRGQPIREACGAPVKKGAMRNAMSPPCSTCTGSPSCFAHYRANPPFSGPADKNRSRATELRWRGSGFKDRGFESWRFFVGVGLTTSKDGQRRNCHA